MSSSRTTPKSCCASPTTRAFACATSPSTVGITERSAHRIVTELAEDGYIARERVGRRNVYTVKPERPLHHPLAQETEQRRIGDLLEVLLGDNGRRHAGGNPGGRARGGRAQWATSSSTRSIAAANATLLTAVTIMLFLPNPKRLLIGYLLGGLLVSLTIGFVIVFVVHQSGATSTTQNSVSPAMDIALGLLLLVAAYVLRSERMERRRERKKKEKEGVEKGPSRVERVLGKGSARITFLVGMVLTLPGVSYLAALHELDNLNYSASGDDPGHPWLQRHAPDPARDPLGGLRARPGADGGRGPGLPRPG